MDGTKGSVYDYLLFVFGTCLANHIQIILRNFNSKREREDNFRATIGYYSVHTMAMQLNSKLRHIRNQWRTQELFSGGVRDSTNSIEDRGQRERGSGGGSPPVRDSGGSCNLVRGISFHIVKFS